VNIDIQSILGAVLVIGARLTGLMLFAPFFGSVAIPARVKALLVIAMTALLYPVLSGKLPSLEVSQWPMMFLGELVIGAAIGIAMNIVFDGVQMAGQVLSVQMGYSLVNIMDPQTQVQSTVMATFHQTIALLIFLRLNVELLILQGIIRSFDYLPPASGHIRGAFVAAILHACGSVFVIGIQIAAPVMCATFVADIALGLLGKASPQLPVMLLGPAVKSILGLMILFFALRYWPDEFGHLFQKFIGMTDHLLHLAA
jgi:flagellar biosynthetic protein FliR